MLSKFINKIKYLFQDPEVKFIILNDTGQIPSYAHDGDAGMDIRSSIDCTILPSEHKIIPIGIAIQLPLGYEAQIRSRSGLAAKNQVFVLNGVGSIDFGYTGQIQVILFNLGRKPFPIKKGDRIAQMIINKISKANMVKVSSLSDSERGQKGFGSTGIK